MTENPVVIADIEELLAEVHKPGGEIEIWAQSPDVVPAALESASQAETPAVLPATTEKPVVKIPVEEQIAGDSDIVATVPDDTSLPTFVSFLEGHESNPNLPPSSAPVIKPVGEIFTRISPRRIIASFAAAD